MEEPVSEGMKCLRTERIANSGMDRPYIMQACPELCPKRSAGLGSRPNQAHLRLKALFYGGMRLYTVSRNWKLIRIFAAD